MQPLRYDALLCIGYACSAARVLSLRAGMTRAKKKVAIEPRKSTDMSKGLSAPASWIASHIPTVHKDSVDADSCVSGVLLERYFERVESGAIELDPAQEHVLLALDRLSIELASYRPVRKASGLGRLFGSRASAMPPQGLYIWGSVGRGKTMLMDLFFDETRAPHKQRLHFQAFMADVHARIFAIRQQMKKGLVKGDDPIAPVAEAIAEESWLICLDEFTVTDIADAMILGRLFTQLFQRGVVVVATSNVEPSELYKDGLNRALFLPFIDLLREKTQILHLAARTDFRLEKLKGEPVYHMPADAKAHAALSRAFTALTGVAEAPGMRLDVLGRGIVVPQAKAHVARFDFKDLCHSPLGPRDFLAIAQNFHTVLVDAVPIIRSEEADVAKRFILLIDALYDQHVKLIASAAAEPAELYQGTSGREAFEFARTASRLMEMRSATYLGLPHGSIASIGSGATTGLVET
jgi:cell division protein ZapE